MNVKCLYQGRQFPRPHPNKLKFIFIVATLGLFIYVMSPRDSVSTFQFINSKYKIFSRNRELHNKDLDVLEKTVTTEKDFTRRYMNTDTGDNSFDDDNANKNIAKHAYNYKIAINQEHNDPSDKKRNDKSKSDKTKRNDKSTSDKTKQEKTNISTIKNNFDKEDKNVNKEVSNSHKSLNISQSTVHNSEQPMKLEQKQVDPYRIKSLLELSKEDDLNTRSDLKELQSKHIICTINRYKGHLGNRLFMFASGYGIAKANNMTFIIAQNIILRAYFKLTIPFVKQPRPGALFPQQVHGGDGKFSEKLLHLKPQHTEVSGYLQSFKYFHRYKDELFKELTFVQSTLDYVKDFLSPIRKTCPGGCTLIGVQIRRGNILTQQNKDDGHRAANVSFFNKAMDYFSHKYKNVRFVICTNDQGWVKQNFNSTKTHTFYLSGYRNPEDRDLAVLSKCDHTIFASSTYGWWGAYLAGGDVVYYNGHPKPGSKLARQYNLKDFYFDEWIPMSD
ncbi:unnamed protein product [Owenia fusiformis]|uniref:L-Fucosyltransferase n=1 Tax=Owenia fusiformis TaxID=6347 RepID=A0A8S4NXT4_OWEFU|nr:unnamed protein product [Owenia fusiformis]